MFGKMAIEDVDRNYRKKGMRIVAENGLMKARLREPKVLPYFF